TFIDGGLTIDKAAATVTANSDTVTYNGGAQSVSGFTASGLVGGEDEGVLTGVATSGGTGTNAGRYVHTASGTDGNYDLTFIDGGLTIDKALATVTANSDTVTYNGSNQSVSGFTASGLVGGEDESVLTGVATSGGTGTNAGRYVHTASGTDGNYALTFIDGGLTIDKATATVTANSDTVTYNGSVQNVTGFTASGLVGGEDEGVLSGVTTSGGSGTDAGNYVHTASGSDGNYALTFIGGGLTIDKAAATVTANSDTVTYNGSNQSVSGFTASGLVGGEDESVLSSVTTS
ncbi:MBG domain-containing protein, partial [Halomonas sp. THAF12]|uniref:MBG domain-containing protein n=1 Tax=Halomonas sp. B23F22_10 TaxID=3459515 RepID=UPI00373E2CA6